MAWRGSKLRPSAASGFAEAGALFAFNIQYLEEKYSRVESQVSVDEQEIYDMSGDDVVVMQEATRDLEKEFGLTHRGFGEELEILTPNPEATDLLQKIMPPPEPKRGRKRKRTTTPLRSSNLQNDGKTEDIHFTRLQERLNAQFKRSRHYKDAKRLAADPNFQRQISTALSDAPMPTTTPTTRPTTTPTTRPVHKRPQLAIKYDPIPPLQLDAISVASSRRQEHRIQEDFSPSSHPRKRARHCDVPCSPVDIELADPPQAQDRWDLDALLTEHIVRKEKHIASSSTRKSPRAMGLLKGTCERLKRRMLGSMDAASQESPAGQKKTPGRRKGKKDTAKSPCTALVQFSAGNREKAANQRLGSDALALLGKLQFNPSAYDRRQLDYALTSGAPPLPFITHFLRRQLFPQQLLLPSLASATLFTLPSHSSAASGFGAAFCDRPAQLAIQHVPEPANVPLRSGYGPAATASGYGPAVFRPPQLAILPSEQREPPQPSEPGNGGEQLWEEQSNRSGFCAPPPKLDDSTGRRRAESLMGLEEEWESLSGEVSDGQTPGLQTPHTSGRVKNWVAISVYHTAIGDLSPGPTTDFDKRARRLKSSARARNNQLKAGYSA